MSRQLSELRIPFTSPRVAANAFRSPSSEVRVEAIAELFNVFNAKNPSIPLTTQRLSANGAPLSSFMQPTGFAGDVQQPEQRVGQIGFRVTF